MINGPRNSERAAGRVHCTACPLRRLPCFTPLSDAEQDFMVNFKNGELNVDPGAAVVMEGSTSPHLFTVLEGAGVRYKTLENGRRQVIGFVLPGDFVGLQAAIMETMEHTVEARTKMVLCLFQRSSFRDMFQEMPSRSFDAIWLAAREEHFLGNQLLTVGRRQGRERVAFGLTTLHRRASELGIAEHNAMDMPFTQQDLADALGLSLVHTNKILRRFGKEGTLEWRNRRLTILDPVLLAEIGMVETERSGKRPLI